MKEKLKKSSVLEQWFDTQSPLVISRPALRETLNCLIYLFSGFVLSCGRLGGQPVPFVVGLLVAAGGGLHGLSALVGAVLGYLLMQPFSLGLELTSISLLTFVTMYIFGTLWITKQRWFRCLVPGIMSAAIGAIFLLSQSLTPLLLAGYGQSIFLSALSPLAFDALLSRRRSIGALLAICFFLLGAAMLPTPWGLNLGLILAVFLTAVVSQCSNPGTAIFLSVGMGLSLDGALMAGGGYTLALTAAAFAGSALSRRRRFLRTGLFVVGFTAAVLYIGLPSRSLFLNFGIGVLLSIPIPARWTAGQEENMAQQIAHMVEQQLGVGAVAFRQLYDAIGVDPDAAMTQEQTHIFDQATYQVCRDCTRYSYCWEKHSTETYQAMRSSTLPMLNRRQALREDFPTDFAANCCHMEGLLTALNQALNEALCRRQLHNRAEESRLIASRCFLYMSRLMEQCARQFRCVRRFPDEVYSVKLGVSAAGRHGSRISGDRGVSFHMEDGRFFVLLSDGMGTGPDAAKESMLAVDTLSALIQSGMQPDQAMELLSGMYILRNTGVFSTMDILELSLITGQGTLYKWGAAPSYLKCSNVVKKIGTAAPPPGIDAGSADSPERIRLSLWEGDMLVLVSDGAAGEQAQGLIGRFDGENVKALSSQLVALAADLGGEDDMTAAVIRLGRRRL